MILAAIIIFGLIFGSFLNVVIYRLPKKNSLVSPGSKCPACENPVRFYDNIPVLSYLFLRGKCRHCGVSISVRYPVVEILTALCMVLLYLKYGFSLQCGGYIILILFLIPIGFIDWDTGFILNKLTLPGFVLGIFFILLFF